MYYVALQALGDNLVSIYLLNQLDKKINVIGTKHTENIVQLVELEDNFDVKVIFDDIPAFYDIRNQGILKTIKDIFKFRKYIKKQNIKELIFEKKDFRIMLLTFGLNVKNHSSNKYSNVYYNRKNLIREAYSKLVDIDDTISYEDNIHTILISPVTRLKKKNIVSEHLNVIVKFLKNNGFKIQLVDYSKEYNEFANKVDEYFVDTTLEDMKNLMNSCSLYIGADSFLVHLAYYCKKPYFIIFNQANETFLPPISKQVDNYIVIDESIDLLLQLERKFIDLGLFRSGPK